jgi:hypothetical protein
VTITQPCASEWHCRPDYAGGALVHDNWKENGTQRCVAGGRCSVQYINRSAFAFVPVDPGTRIAVRSGNTAVGMMRNPATWTIDFSLSKNIRIRESVNLQFRTDMFNSLNHVNYGGPTSGLDAATFGEINGAGGMRVVQLNMRLAW